MASEVDICNRALQKLGASRITSLTQDSPNARSCNVAYEPLRDSLLRRHPWRFAIERASLAADSTAPDWGKSASYTLPSDYLQLLPTYPEDNLNSLDWEVEGGKIYTDDSAPLYIRYIKRVTNTGLFDANYSEALSCLIALELCEEIAQSNSKKESLREDFEQAIRDAKKANAFESIAQQPPEDTWITSRL